jgi:hypothetical protein
VTAGHGPPSYDEADPFDLPDWLGECDVTWEAAAGPSSGHRIAGALTATGREPFLCDMLAVDDAYPQPVAADATRVRAHQLWRHGEVLVASDAGHLLLAVPGSRLDTETVLEAVGRLGRAVGARPGAYAVRLRVNPERS